MLIQRLAGLLCAIAVVGAAALSTAISARADDSVTASDGWVSGRVTKEEPGHNGEQTRRTKDTQPSTQSPPYYDPLDCVRPVGAGAAVDCERDLPEPASGVELLFVPPTEAEVRVALHLPDPTPRFGPDPSVNEWKMLAVGYPIWLWTDAPTELSATATHDGLSMTLRAEWTSTSFEMGAHGHVHEDDGVSEASRSLRRAVSDVWLHVPEALEAGPRLHRDGLDPLAGVLGDRWPFRHPDHHVCRPAHAADRRTPGPHPRLST